MKNEYTFSQSPPMYTSFVSILILLTVVILIIMIGLGLDAQNLQQPAAASTITMPLR